MKRNVREKFSKYDSCNLKNTNGITLIALIVTIIVLLILAGVSLSGVFSERGIFNRAESAGEKYNEAKAREVLETVLMTDGQMEKHTNPKYNQDDFLDKLIKSEIEGSDVKGDIAIVGGYAYELDRSVPKIGRYLGKAEDLVFPTVTATDPVIANDYRSASFTVTALEEKNGVNKIEIWLNGERVETLTKTYDNIKTEITENFTVNRNGVYTIKAYGDLMASVAVEVTGIVPMVEFSPNGSTEWKKEHTTKIIVKETEERVTNIKYKWTTSSTNPPAETEFTENCPSNNVVTGGNDTMTGEYFLWVLLTTESGKTNICGSEGFKFDNKGPEVTLTVTGNSEKDITLSVTAQDTGSGIVKFEFFVDDVKKDTQTIEATTSSVTKDLNVTDLSTGLHTCKVIVYDEQGNEGSDSKEGSTKRYTWKIYSVNQGKVYYQKSTKRGTRTFAGRGTIGYNWVTYDKITLNSNTGVFTGTGGENTYKLYMAATGYVDSPHGRYYKNGSEWLYLISAIDKGNGPLNDWNVIWTVDVISSVRKQDPPTCGSFTGNTVQADTSDVYPNNGEKNGSWYIYDGLK